MFENTATILRLRGIPVRLDLSWVIIALLATWSLSAGFFPQFFSGLEGAYLWMGIAGAFGLFVSIVLHEFCHAFVGGLYGVEIRSITLFVFGGVADMRNEPPTPKAEFRMAAAGPAGSLVLAALFTGLFLLAAWPAPVAGVLFWLGWVNVLLAGFNMVPAFPLDGGRMLRAMLWRWKKSLRWATRVTSRAGSWFGAAMIVLGVLAVLGGNLVGGAWWALLGLWLRSAAKASYHQVLLRRFLEDRRVRDFMTTRVVTVDPDLTVSELIEDYVFRYRFRLYPVARGSELLGYVTVDDVEEVPAGDRGGTQVAELLRRCRDDSCIDPDADMLETLRKLQRTGHHRMIVVENGALAGLVTLKDVGESLALALELEGEERVEREAPGLPEMPKKREREEIGV